MYLEEMLKMKFTLIEEEPEEIDIQSIKEYYYGEFTSLENYKTIQELIQAVKQLDRKIKEEE